MWIFKIQFFIFLFILLLLLPKIFKRPPLWIAFMIVALALVPNSSIFTDERVLGEGFRLFAKYFGGVLSIWDVFILFGFTLILWSKHRILNFGTPSQENRILRIIYVIWFVATINGVAHATFSQYGFTSIRNVIQQVQPSVYLLVSLFLTRIMITKEKDIDLLLTTLSICNYYLIAQGIVLLIMHMMGIVTVMSGFGGIPIVMYDGLLFLTIGMLIVIAKLAYRQQLSIGDYIVLAGGLFFLLASTRRMNLMMLVINIFVIWFAAGSKVFTVQKVFRLVKFAFLTIIPLILVISIVVPEYKDIFIEVVSSINMSSDTGGVSGTLRLAQIANLFLNMNTEAPLSYLWGMGIGTQWFEFIPLIGVNPDGDMAYTAALHEQGLQGWWPYFHIANIAVIYRYGVVGVFVITCAGLVWFFRWVRVGRTIQSKYQPIILVFMVTILETIIVMGDSVDSAWPAQLGIWLGVSEAIIKNRS